MLNLKNYYYSLGGAVAMGFLTASEAHAQAAGAGGSGNNFSSIATNITNSIADLPGLLSGVAYMFGLLLGVLGILKIKDHVENPTQTPLKDGAIRLAAGGALFALPIMFEAMTETIGSDGQTVSAAKLKKIDLAIGS